MASPTPPSDRPDPNSIAERLKQEFGDHIQPTLPLDPEPGPDQDAPGSLFEKLRGAGTRGTRYRLLGEVARGGMGVILKIWDDELRRTLAMKVVLGRGEESRGDTPQVDPRTLGRFLEEAQVTGQLDHPGIVPVHELGLGADGHVYFTMRLVRGEDLRSIFEKVRTGEDGWNQVRALGVMLKVCEAMSFAHSKKVVHRDLKPANVMVGKFGEVYVMDWGLARVLGREDKHDLRIQPQSTTQSVVKTERRERREETPDSPLVTMDGDIVGTPSFMPPEQARGELDRLGPHSDVYSVGAMLYALLAGEMPYVSRNARVSARTVLISVLNGPPKPLFELAPQMPAELIAIVEKAMTREIEGRYPTMQAVAEDLRAFIEGRVVHAYETGAWAEARKWVKRNKLLAASLAAAVIAIAIGGGGFAVKAKEATDARDGVALKNTELKSINSALDKSKSEAIANAEAATRSERAAQAARIEAEQKTDDILSLSAQKDLDDLVAGAEKLWPAFPEMIPQYEKWLAAANELIAGRPGDPTKGIKKRPSLEEHKAKLSELRTRAKPRTAQESVSERLTFDYDDPEAGWWDVQLSRLIVNLEGLRDPRTGLMGDTLAEPFGWGMTKRFEFAEQIAERSLNGAEARNSWARAIAAVKSSPRYGGFDLTPQLGLLPIGMDQDSGLWEFGHLQTGELAVRAEDGVLLLTEETGLVFVLIPGGTFWMGAQKQNQSGKNYDPLAIVDESPVHEVELSPYFLSKYEMTQGQWERFSGKNPSHFTRVNYSSNWNRAGKGWSALHPVEQVTWMSCMEVLGRLGCELPTEAQWENACRARTSSVYWSGDGLEDLGEVANVSDAFGKSNGAEGWAVWETDVDDGNTAHAEVGSYLANAFGLLDVHGNVWEWCRDGYADYSSGRQVDPVAPWTGSAYRVSRGGTFSNAASYARSAIRGTYTPETLASSLGLRPARAITP